MLPWEFFLIHTDLWPIVITGTALFRGPHWYDECASLSYIGGIVSQSTSWSASHSLSFILPWYTLCLRHQGCVVGVSLELAVLTPEYFPGIGYLPVVLLLLCRHRWSTYLKRLSWRSFSCRDFSAGWMISRNMWMAPFLPCLLPLTMHEFSMQIA